MLTVKPLFEKVYMSCILVVALSITSCAQQQEKEESKETKQQSKTTAMKKVSMPVSGMVCSACQSNVKNTMKSLNGISEVEVSLEKKYAYFLYDPSKIKPEQIQKAVNDKGYLAGKIQEVSQ
nr:heavy-metal-associated domain-containing protein [uncultured Dyadobacter sp.]